VSSYVFLQNEGVAEIEDGEIADTEVDSGVSSSKRPRLTSISSLSASNGNQPSVQTAQPVQPDSISFPALQTLPQDMQPVLPISFQSEQSPPHTLQPTPSISIANSSPPNHSTELDTLASLISAANLDEAFAHNSIQHASHSSPPETGMTILSEGRTPTPMKTVGTNTSSVLNHPFQPIGTLSSTARQRAFDAWGSDGSLATCSVPILKSHKKGGGCGSTSRMNSATATSTSLTSASEFASHSMTRTTPVASSSQSCGCASGSTQLRSKTKTQKKGKSGADDLSTTSVNCRNESKKSHHKKANTVGVVSSSLTCAAVVSSAPTNSLSGASVFSSSASTSSRSTASGRASTSAAPVRSTSLSRAVAAEGDVTGTSQSANANPGSPGSTANSPTLGPSSFQLTIDSEEESEEQSGVQFTGPELAILKSKYPIPEKLLNRITEQSRVLIPKIKMFRTIVSIQKWSQLLEILQKLEGEQQKAKLTEVEQKLLTQFCSPTRYGQFSTNELLFLVLCSLFAKPMNYGSTMFARCLKRKVSAARSALHRYCDYKEELC